MHSFIARENVVAIIEQVKESLDLKDFVRVEEVQAAFLIHKKE